MEGNLCAIVAGRNTREQRSLGPAKNSLPHYCPTPEESKTVFSPAPRPSTPQWLSEEEPIKLDE